MTEQQTSLVEQIDDLAQLIGLDVKELHELHQVLSRRVTRIRIPDLDVVEPLAETATAEALPEIVSTTEPVGICGKTGRSLSGFDYVEHYIGKVLTTRIGSRVMRRHLGTEVPEAQDAAGSSVVILQVFRSIAEAVDKYVPWYKLKEIVLADAGRSGDYLFLMAGTYYPNAHKGDYITSEERLARVAIVGAGADA